MVHKKKPGSLISHPATYRVRISGRLSPHWADYLQGMTFAIVETGDQATVTEIKGRLPDQAALMGILQHLYSFAIPLLSVECLDICNQKGESE
ncbi:conserved hypothetical protein [Desulfosarcina cetonica]|uniref:hypothetical protein n=1 Tax=Desulfosarcina cetonica TaxID=90730 RepID=UPI0006CFA9C4|nr:hypothetical protein [Desulfosarcina cetonica]VTR67437.1 conserved hypothetical protein [Desulfosarcina cetonica]